MNEDKEKNIFGIGIRHFRYYYKTVTCIKFDYTPFSYRKRV